MKLNSSIRLNASRDKAWAALNDVEVLRTCIPGCESLSRMPDGTLEARVTAKVGPVSARFSGKVQLVDVVAPESYRIVFTGQGGAAGFARGEARVHLLQEAADTTQLQYATEATVGGKLAQIGSRLIESSARKLADDFFSQFERALRETGQPEMVPDEAHVSPAPVTRGSSSQVKWAIVTGGLALAVFVYLLFV